MPTVRTPPACKIAPLLCVELYAAVGGEEYRCLRAIFWIKPQSIANERTCQQLKS